MDLYFSLSQFCHSRREPSLNDASVLAMRLRKERTLSKARIYSDEELAAMLTEDQRVTGTASEWLRTAKGSVRAAAGESVDDARMAYYAAKYGVKP